MRYLKYFVIFALMLGIFAGVSVSASETETDWSQVDWTTIDWGEINWDTVDVSEMMDEMDRYMDAQRDFSLFYDLCNWLEQEGEPKHIFAVMYNSDGMSAQILSNVLYRRFVLDPYGIIQAIALEAEDSQYLLASAIVFGYRTEEELSLVLGGVELPETATDAERAVWAEIIREAELRLDVVPTGDGIGMPMILLLASTAGLALLVSKKRMLVK